MLTPQQIQKTVLERTRFGGYSIQSVDDFLEPLTEDYLALYNENDVLKQKMIVLVKKLEEYREKEAEINAALMNAYKTCDDMVADAQRKCAQMLDDASARAAAKAEDAQAAGEEDRLKAAKELTAAYAASLEEQMQKMSSVIQALKDGSALPAPAKQGEKQKRRAFKFDAEEQTGGDDIANTIISNMRKLVGEQGDSLGDTKKMEPIGRDQRQDLQFGRNYNPKKV